MRLLCAGLCGGKARDCGHVQAVWVWRQASHSCKRYVIKSVGDSDALDPGGRPVHDPAVRQRQGPPHVPPHHRGPAPARVAAVERGAGLGVELPQPGLHPLPPRDTFNATAWHSYCDKVTATQPLTKLFVKQLLFKLSRLSTRCRRRVSGSGVKRVPWIAEQESIG
jgi:hypothetical protein